MVDVQTLVDKLALTVHTGESLLDRKVSGGYTADLLSNVMAGAKEGQVWITVQMHQNVVAVASLLNLAAIIIAGTDKPSEEVFKKAVEHDVIIITTPKDSFSIAGQIYIALTESA